MHLIYPKLFVTNLLYLSQKTSTIIIDQIIKGGYFSISVDSTPIITHMDQQTIILRYVNSSGPVERFINYIHIISYTGAYLFAILLLRVYSIF